MTLERMPVAERLVDNGLRRELVGLYRRST